MTGTIPLRADLDYLLAPRNAWWRWSDDGRWLEWSDGRTIAAREELRAVLERLAPRGLPPIGAVLLLLAATRNGWNAETSARLFVASAATLETGSGPGTHVLFDGVIERRLRLDATKITDDIAGIAALPADLRESVAAKAALADYLFLDSYVAIAPQAAEGVLGLLVEGFGVDVDAARRDMDPLKRTDLEFSALRPGLARIQTSNLELWMKTGLDALVKPATLNVPQAKQVRALLHDLRDDVELSALARMASQLLAVIHVPRNLRSQEELSLGGISDISNRGSFDRLLISELANDPLTLAVRVAMNEALYIRREAPARHPPVTRTVLIDGGIRMWGVPRLYACAVALALAAASDPNEPCQVLRASGKTAAPVDFTSRAGLEDHLAQLSPWPDPVDALMNYASAADTSEARSEELMLIVERGTFDDDAFWRKIAPLLDRFTLYVAAVAQDGSFEFVLPARTGRRQVAAARFDLAQLLEAKSPAAPKRIVARDPSLPLILQLPEFPLRLPAQVNPRYAAATLSTGLVGVTRDQRLMQWANERVGARSLLHSLPSGELRGVYVDADRNVAYVCVTRRKAHRLILVTIDLESGARQDKEYAVDHPSAIVLHRGVFLLMARQTFSVLHPDSGDITQHRVPSDATWSSGRFYRNWHYKNLFAAAEGGAVLVRGDFNDLLAFDRASHGPWALRSGWSFNAIDSDESVRPRYFTAGRREQPPAQFIPSADGDRVLLVGQKTKTGFTAVAVDLNGAATSSFNDEVAAFGFLLGEPVRWSLQAGIGVLSNFGEIAVDDEGEIVISHGRVRPRHVAMRVNARGELRVEAVTKEITLRAAQPFGPRRRVSGARYRLREARWPNGSRVWLDSRGMLHLKSDHASLPEITCVLSSKGGLAGWTSDGHTFGWRYFLGGEPTLTDAHAAQLLRTFAERLT